jgi:hypothetical protein
MTTSFHSLAAQLRDLTDDDLVASLQRVQGRHRHTTAELLAHLIEVERRRLHLDQSFSSLHVYATETLLFSDSEAYHRIGAARAAARFPAVLDMVACGELTLSTVNQLKAHLDGDNYEELLEAARGKSRRQIQHLLAERFPKPDAATQVRKMPARVAAAPAPTGTTAPAPSPAVTPATKENDSRASASPCTREQPPRPVISAAASAAPALVLTSPKHADLVEPTSRERYKVAFAAPRTLVDKLEQARNLLSHKLPGADFAAVFELGLDLLIAQEEKRRFAVGTRRRKAKTEVVPAAKAPEPLVLTPPPDLGNAPDPEVTPPAPVTREPVEAGEAEREPDPTPAARSRYCSAEVREQVYRRDQGRCTYVDPETGRRCGSAWKIELDHLHEWALGGPNTSENMTLRCKRHNLHRARKTFGDHAVDCAIERSGARRRRSTATLSGESPAPHHISER